MFEILSRSCLTSQYEIARRDSRCSAVRLPRFSMADLDVERRPHSEPEMWAMSIFGRSSSFRVIPQIGPLILCLGVAVRTLQFLPLRRKLRLLWNKIVSQIAPFDFRIRKARRAILASKIPAWHKRQYAPNIWTELSAVCGMLPPCRSIACLVYPCGVKRHKPLLPGPKKKRP